MPDGGKLDALRTLLDRAAAASRSSSAAPSTASRSSRSSWKRSATPSAALQGNLSQNARDRVMADFRSGETPILLATNVAARGLDVENVGQVINYELPETAELLTHRVGRTGRMGRDGEAITLLAPDDEPAWRKLLRDLKQPPRRIIWRGRHESQYSGLHHAATPPRRVVPAPPSAPAPAAVALAARAAGRRRAIRRHAASGPAAPFLPFRRRGLRPAERPR